MPGSMGLHHLIDPLHQKRVQLAWLLDPERRATFSDFFHSSAYPGPLSDGRYHQTLEALRMRSASRNAMLSIIFQASVSESGGLQRLAFHATTSSATSSG